MINANFLFMQICLQTDIKLSTVEISVLFKYSLDLSSLESITTYNLMMRNTHNTHKIKRSENIRQEAHNKRHHMQGLFSFLRTQAYKKAAVFVQTISSSTGMFPIFFCPPFKLTGEHFCLVSILYK